MKDNSTFFVVFCVSFLKSHHDIGGNSIVVLGLSCYEVKCPGRAIGTIYDWFMKRIIVGLPDDWLEIEWKTDCAVINEGHDWVSLEDLVAYLSTEDTKARMAAKEEKFEKLFKLTSKALSEYDNKTAEMTDLLLVTKDEQV